MIPISHTGSCIVILSIRLILSQYQFKLPKIDVIGGVCLYVINKFIYLIWLLFRFTFFFGYRNFSWKWRLNCVYFELNFIAFDNIYRCYGKCKYVFLLIHFKFAVSLKIEKKIVNLNRKKNPSSVIIKWWLSNKWPYHSLIDVIDCILSIPTVSGIIATKRKKNKYRNHGLIPANCWLISEFLRLQQFFIKQMQIA